MVSQSPNQKQQPIECNFKPAKRGAATPAEASTPKARRSNLAKEHNITGEEESEIKEAFKLFSNDKKGEKEGVIPIGDVRRAMMYLFPSNTGPSNSRVTTNACNARLN